MTADLLGNRALNRALLARQLLLERKPVGVLEVAEHLVGMQAQNPRDPYFGIWSRVSDFDPKALSSLVEARQVVRLQVMRGTIHLTTAGDALALRPLLQPNISKVFGSTAFSRNTADIDREELLGFGRALLEERPLTRAELAPLLAERFPGPDPASLAQAVTYLLPVVQVPPRGTWDSTGPAAWTTLRAFLGTESAPPLSPTEVVRRYLPAFGPAATEDVRTWSGMTRVAEALEPLLSELRPFTDDHGRKLWDIEEGPRPDPDVAAPVRFLPEYDNVLLGHADRTRVIPAGVMPPGWKGNVLVDGFLAAAWKPETNGGAVDLVIEPLRKLTKLELGEVGAEGGRLLEWLAGERAGEVRIGRRP
jgi:hypothetical protein